MGVDMTTPRNLKALAGTGLRGAVPNLHTWGIGIAKDSLSPLGIQEQRGRGDGSCP